MIRPAMTVGFDTRVTVDLRGPISPQQQNVLHVLGEFPNRFVSQTDLSERLGVTFLAARIQVCRLRKQLTHDWTIQFTVGRGYRLIDMREK